MRRFFTNNKPLLAILSFVAVLFVIPGVTHAGVVIPDWLDTSTSVFGTLISWPLEIFILPLASFFMFLGGQLMDIAINFGLHTAYIFSLSPAINLGWVIIRDICNIFFIFVLIYISLGTIVKGTSFGTKSLLTQVIIAALLINFSLFFTKVIIDASNVFGLWLYGGVTKTLQVNSEAYAEVSISGLIATRLEVFQYGFGDGKPNKTNANPNSDVDPSKSFTGRVLRLAVILIATYIFFYTAILFVARSITLLFLMVFSPIGFMGGVLPQLAPYEKDWRSELSTAAMFPIAYLLMLYISLQFINSLELLKDSFPKGAAAGGDFTIAQYFQYFIIIFMLKACLDIAKKNSGSLGKTLSGAAEGLGKIATGLVLGAATGGAGVVLRTTVGRGAAALGESQFAKNMVGSSSIAGRTFGKSLTSATKWTSKQSFDATKVASGALGSIGGIKTQVPKWMSDPKAKDGYIGAKKAKEKEHMDTALSLSATKEDVDKLTAYKAANLSKAKTTINTTVEGKANSEKQTNDEKEVVKIDLEVEKARQEYNMINHPSDGDTTAFNNKLKILEENKKKLTDNIAVLKKEYEEMAEKELDKLVQEEAKNNSSIQNALKSDARVKNYAEGVEKGDLFEKVAGGVSTLGIPEIFGYSSAFGAVSAENKKLADKIRDKKKMETYRSEQKEEKEAAKAIAALKKEMKKDESEGGGNKPKEEPSKKPDSPTA